MLNENMLRYFQFFYLIKEETWGGVQINQINLISSQINLINVKDISANALYVFLFLSLLFVLLPLPA